MGAVTASGGDFVATVMPSVDLVHNLARRLARHHLDAEDLAQDTLTKAWDAWSKGIRPDSVGAWLSTICLNLARDRGRRAARSLQAPWPEDFERADPVDVEEQAIGRVQRAVVDGALWTLPEPQRIAIVLMDICGLTAAETSAITEAPRGTVLARVHRGRKALARAVHDQARGAPPPGPGRPSADTDEERGEQQR